MTRRRLILRGGGLTEVREAEVDMTGPSATRIVVYCGVGRPLEEMTDVAYDLDG
jgi:hypothetical protein